MSIGDVRKKPAHPKHAEAQALRTKLVQALQNQTHLDFRTQDLVLTVVQPSTHNRLTLLLQQRDKLEKQIEHLLENTPLDADIEATYDKLSNDVNNLNRNMYQIYVDFLPTTNAGGPNACHGVFHTGRVRSTTRKSRGPLESVRHELAPYNATGLKEAAKRKTAQIYNDKCDEIERYHELVQEGIRKKHLSYAIRQRAQEKPLVSNVPAPADDNATTTPYVHPSNLQAM
jgi:hypothetical protein